MRQQGRDIGGACFQPHVKHGDQHQDRAQKRVEEKLEGRVDPVLAAPDADDQEHRDQTGLEHDIEKHQIKRAKKPRSSGFPGPGT